MLSNIYFLGGIAPCGMFLGGYLMYWVRFKYDSILGYRTGAALRNADTWEFANSYSGILWMKWSVPLLVISELILYLWQPSTAACIMLLQLIPVLAITPVTEKALAKTFDRQGNRREEK